MMENFHARIIAALILTVGLCRMGEAQAVAKSDSPPTDRHAGLLEVLPPATMHQAPAAVALIDRLINRHIIMLRSPALITQVMQSGDLNGMAWVKDKPEASVERLIAAMHLRAIHDTNIIEIAVDPSLVADDEPKVIETIVSQYLDNEKRISINKDLEKSVMLNNLKNRFQFRKDDLNRALREKAVQLSVDGIGTPGRVSMKEVELQNLMQQKFELQRKVMDATSDEAKKSVAAQQKGIDERIDAAKADLGALTNAMNQYLAFKEDEQANREQLRKVNEQLEKIQQETDIVSITLQWLVHPSR